VPPIISGNVWLDKNGNGLNDAGEEGVGDVTVNLISFTGSLLEEQITSSGGSYAFGDLSRESVYTVQVMLPSGYAFTEKDVGGDDAKDSDVFESGASIGRSEEISNLAAANGFVDAGLTDGPAVNVVEDEAMVVITGFVWLDANSSGLYEAGEALLPDVEVSLLGTDTGLSVLESVKTDSAGNFSFSPRAATGTYRLFYFSPTDYAFTKKDQGEDDSLDSDVWDAGQNLGHTDIFDLARGAPPDLSAGLLFDIFTPVSSSADLEAYFTVSSLPCGDMASNFTIPYHVELVDDFLTMTSDVEGSTATGKIERDGQFHLEDVNGRENFEGLFNRDWTGEATNLYKDDSGCVTPFKMELKPIEVTLADALLEIQSFYAIFNAAFDKGDTTQLLELLHPAVVDHYGSEVCESYLLQSILNPVRVEPLEVREFGEWDWEVNSGVERIDSAYTININVSLPDGGVVNQDTHLALRPDGSLGWFTYCDNN